MQYPSKIVLNFFILVCNKSWLSVTAHFKVTGDCSTHTNITLITRSVRVHVGGNVRSSVKRNFTC